AAGIVLREHATRLLLEAGEACTEVRNVGKSALPTLSLLVQPSLARTLAPELVSAIRKDTPVSNVCVHSGFAMDHEHALLSRQVDMLVSTKSFYEIDALERYDLVSEPYVVLLPANRSGHPADVHRLA